MTIDDLIFLFIGGVAGAFSSMLAMAVCVILKREDEYMEKNCEKIKDNDFEKELKQEKEVE